MPTIRILPPGSASNFSRDSGGKAYGLNWDDGEIIPLVPRPIEVLASSAIGFPITQTGIDEILDHFVIPAGTLGINSIIQIEPLWTFTNSANNKLLKVRIGSSIVYNVTRTTSVKEAPLIVLANRGSLQSQIQPYDNDYLTSGATTPSTYAIDFAYDVFVQIIGQRANAGDTLRLEYYRCLHFIGD